VPNKWIQSASNEGPYLNFTINKSILPPLPSLISYYPPFSLITSLITLSSLFTHLIYFSKDRAKQMDTIRQQRGSLPQLHHQQIHPPRANPEKGIPGRRKLGPFGRGPKQEGSGGVLIAKYSQAVPRGAPAVDHNTQLPEEPAPDAGVPDDID